MSAAWTWGAYEGGFHAEGIVGGKFFVRIEFGREGLEIRVQSFTTLHEFNYGERAGLEGVSEGAGLQGKMHIRTGCERVVSVNLSFDGPSKSGGQILS